MRPDEALSQYVWWMAVAFVAAGFLMTLAFDARTQGAGLVSMGLGFAALIIHGVLGG